MDSILKKGLFLVTLTGTLTAFPTSAQAYCAEVEVDVPGIEEVLDECYSADGNIEIKTNFKQTDEGEYSKIAFADVETFLYVRSEPTKESEWVGKLYPGDAANIVGPIGEWTEVESGTVTGYVYSYYITVGEEAEKQVQQLVEEAEKNDVEEEIFSYAESKEEEQQRLEKEAIEEEKKAKEEQEQKEIQGKKIVDYACQFIGNPYVWGGTSLTSGADCSGFVQSVFAEFGVNLPRTSAEMRSVGTEVSYENAIPGDIICYDGHVGIYMGDGQIVNAINRRRGIGVLSATYSTILTVRRLI